MTPEELEIQRTKNELHNKKTLENYHNNKEKINEKIDCEICGKSIMKRNIKSHYVSKKCFAMRTEN